jgi:hypothetical protein
MSEALTKLEKDVENLKKLTQECVESIKHFNKLVSEWRDLLSRYLEIKEG